jgi:hypothetical protein
MKLEKHEGKMRKDFKRIASGLNAAEEETFDLTRRGRENWMNAGILEGAHDESGNAVDQKDRK